MEREVEALLGLNYAAIQDKTQLENAIVQHKATIANVYQLLHSASTRRMSSTPSPKNNKPKEYELFKAGDYPQPHAADIPREQ